MSPAEILRETQGAPSRPRETSLVRFFDHVVLARSEDERDVEYRLDGNGDDLADILRRSWIVKVWADGKTPHRSWPLAECDEDVVVRAHRTIAEAYIKATETAPAVEFVEVPRGRG